MTHLYVSSVDPSVLIGWSRQCRSTPSAIAIDFDSGSWTYAELDRVASNVAAWLLQTDWRPGQSVGLCVDRSPEAIAAMLGVMKAGGVFVPLDPDYPVDRLSYMVADAGVQKILGHEAYYRAIGAHLVRDAVWVDVQTMIDPGDPGDQTDVAFPIIEPDALAYIMYTSGSTGKPKGVEISHSALATYCDADIDVYQLTPSDRTLQFSTLCFDIAIEEIFPPLLSGGCVVIRPTERSCEHNELSDMVRRFDVTAIHLATAYWHQWVDLMVASNAKVPASLRLVIATGEKVSVEHYRRWQLICDHDVLWCNAYGPTETTVTATVFIPDRDFDAAHMPIGKPLKHYTAFILDQDHHPVNQDQTGDLYIGGPALATGYHHREDLNEKAFIHTMIDGQSHRLYRTGDLARWLPDGNIEFAGRIDHQIKLGSYRIEPGEIDAVLNQAPGVRESLVTYEQIGNQKSLIAYVATGTSRVQVNDLCAFARQSLPPYMVPTRYVLLTAMPKTINGKIDRDQLPDPSQAIAARTGDYVAPRTELEQQLVTVWQDVLGIPEIGMHDDFFLLGGSSLLVTQVVARLTADSHIDLPVRDFFANPTVATLADHLEVLTGRTGSQHVEADWAAIRNRLPIVKPQFLSTSTGRLYLNEYRCPHGTSESAVLICQSIGHEYARGYRNVQQLALMLSAAGHHVLRFDYFGTGNSEGGCEDLTAEMMRQNAIEMKNYLRSLTEAKNLDVIGVRWGAWVAAELATAESSFTSIDRAVYWDPVIDGGETLDQFDRFHAQQFKGFMRFNTRRRDITIDQTYGHAMPLAKRTSLSAMKLRDTTSSEWTIASAGSLRSLTESQWRLRQANLIDVQDVIGWDDAAFTESAFSSPESYRTILQLLHRPTQELY